MISDYLHPHMKAITHNTQCLEGMLLGGQGGEGVAQIFRIVVTMTITLGKFPCTMQNNEENAEKGNLTRITKDKDLDKSSSN